MLNRMRGQRLDYSIERQHYEGFVGREATLAELDRLLLDGEPDRRVAVTGGPGMGKTAILATWLVRCEAARVSVPHHFIRRDRYGWNDRSAIARSITAQIEDRYPAHRDPEAWSEAHLVELLARVSARELVPSGRRLVLLVDGLDEYDLPSDVCDPLAALVPDALPRGVRFLCASRPRHPHLDGFGTRHGELVRLDLDDPSAAGDNDATVRAFWCREAPRLGLDDRFIERAVLRADGNMQHATMLRTHLASVPHSQRSVEGIPRGLSNLLAMLWQRVAGDPLAVRGLGILCAAREQLSLDEIGLVADWSNLAEQRAFAHVARELLVENRRGDGVAEYRLDHDSIRAYLVDQLGPIAVRSHHQALACKLASWPARRDATARRYALRHALAHRVEAGDWPAVQATACDIGFLEAKFRELGVHDVEADVMRAAEQCRAAGDTAIGRELGDLARALARESRRLRDDPTMLAALLGSRLRRKGWRAEEPNRRGRMPAGDAEPVRDATSATHPALLRDLVGHGAPRPASSRHVILFLAANPNDTSRLVLEDECAAIERELQMAAHGGDFEFRSKWAVTVDEMARHLIKLEPTVVHFSGHGTGGDLGPASATSRDVVGPEDSGIYLQDEQRRSQLVTARALAMMITSAAPSARVVVLNACYSDGHAEALCSVVECVVGMTRAIHDDAARSFAVGFYRALGHRRSVGNAVEHAVATLAAKQLPDEGVPRCRTRNWIDARQVFL